MKESNLPTRQECFNIMKKYHVPSHILDHSQSVAKLAVFLAKKLNENGIIVDVALVERACLLHDMVRICDFNEVDYSKFKEPVTETDIGRILPSLVLFPVFQVRKSLPLPSIFLTLRAGQRKWPFLFRMNGSKREWGPFCWTTLLK